MNTQQTIAVMLLAHMVADYTLQGWLAEGKQKSWWKKLVPSIERTKYRYDYIAALVCHSLYWSVLVFSPFYSSPRFLAVVLVNAAVHAIIDDLKANRFKLNLIEDQLLHALQMMVTMFLV